MHLHIYIHKLCYQNISISFSFFFSLVEYWQVVLNGNSSFLNIHICYKIIFLCLMKVVAGFFSSIFEQLPINIGK